jgi:flagellar L-ring protein precursor FlgH
LYSDDKAYRAGDVLTIIITEDHKVKNKVERDLERESSRVLNLDGDKISLERILPSVPDLKINTASKKTLQGKADYKDERSIDDRVTVVVQDVQANGNLVVLGTRTREISGDRQTMYVSGIVRPADIAFDNTIKSEAIANFSLIAVSDGVSENYNNPGWLGKILDKIWPF